MQGRYLTHLTSGFMENPLTDIYLIRSSTYVCYHKLFRALITLAISNNIMKRNVALTRQKVPGSGFPQTI